MSHFNQFSAIAEFDFEESRFFWGQIITDPEKATLEGTSNHIEIRHFSSYLMSMEDYADVETDLQTKRYLVDPFKVIVSGTQWSGLQGSYSLPRRSLTDPIALSVHANTYVAPIDTKGRDKLAPLNAQLDDLRQRISFWASFEEQSQATQGAVPIISAKISLKIMESIWAPLPVQQTNSGSKNKRPTMRSQCLDCVS